MTRDDRGSQASPLVEPEKIAGRHIYYGFGTVSEGSRLSAEAHEGKPLGTGTADLGQRYRDHVHYLLKRRELRADIFGAGTFRDPRWGMMLFLMLNHLESRPTTVSDVCLAAQCPTTTALRHLWALIDSGLVSRRDDHVDRRRSYTSLTEKGAQLMTRFLESEFAGERQPRRAD